MLELLLFRRAKTGVGGRPPIRAWFTDLLALNDDTCQRTSA